MIYKSVIYLFFILVFLLSCNSKVNYDIEESKIKQFQSIAPTKIEGVRLSSSDSLGIANKIELISLSESNDIYGVISDITNVPPLHLINITEDKYLAGIGREGRGPGEFLAPGSIFAFERDSVLVLDNENIRLTKINLTNEKHLKNLKNAKPGIINLEFEGLPMEVFPIKRDSYAAIGLIRTGGRENIAILDSTGSQSKLAGEIPNFDADIPPSVHQLAWRSTATSNKNGSRFAVGYYNVDILNIYNDRGELLETTRGPKQDELDYATKNKRLSLSDDTIRAYIDLASTDKRIYALYSGKKITEKKNNLGKYVLVFDWDGNFIKSFELDRYAFSISVDDKKGMLYSIIPESLEPGIYEYNISS
ncbi:TolB-like 6-blade propeller-like [Fodinibius roseus]|uniref:TolB-like 6-blade propeller-like n=1 Tax=Fodinibius roseus TaxID=1194090 RepID=A0A1M5MC24_9BACT|nr:BF3164 family lipoprotein [Fodinibius roseus]SHG74771.1 TolB-like 6-blade propeller-like [Fodinibius roseus]